jgi:glucose-1-phosphate adenylyltransferase
MIHAGTVKLGREGAMSDVAVMILAGGQGERLSILSRQRAKPAVPFGGKYRIIDFALSNCVNSGLYDVAVLTQYRPHSLNEHIGHGRPWDLDRERNGGVVILQPYLGRSTSGWYRGTADAVYHNLFYITRRPYRDVLILAGDHVYAMDYRPMIAQHRERCADVTIAVQPVDWREASRFGVVIVAEDGWVVDFEEKPERPRSNLASMGIYLFRRDLLLDLFMRDHPDAPEFIDFGRDVIPYLIRTARVATYRFDGYWQDVGTVQSYWEANMALLEDEPKLNLYDPNWRIHTRSEERPPAKILEGATVIRSLLSNGCIVEGATVIRSILSPGVIVRQGAVVRDSIVMTDSVIGPGAVVDRCIIDKHVTIGANAYLGWGDDNTPNWLEPSRLNTGITLVGRNAVVPPGVRIGRNVLIGPEVKESDFPGAVVPSGETVNPIATVVWS